MYICIKYDTKGMQPQRWKIRMYLFYKDYFYIFLRLAVVKFRAFFLVLTNYFRIYARGAIF